jgi:caffeoyl-CoA O-methyltransferase
MQNKRLVDAKAEGYAEMFSEKTDPVARSIAKNTSDKLKYDDMLSGYQVTGLIRLLIKLANAKIVAEIGMFTGFASCQLAEALPDDGVLYCLESNHKYIDIAISQMQKETRFSKIQIWKGDARLNVLVLPDNLDLVFLDADKEYYPGYYNILLAKLRTGGIMVIDNVFWRGGVFEETHDRKAKAIKKLVDLIKQDDRVDSVMLTVRDGLIVLMKL